MKNNMM